MYRTLEFASAWPDDPEFDGEGNPLVPGARDLMVAIAEQLQIHVNNLTNIEQHSFYGWEFSCSFGDAKYNCVLNPANDKGYLTLHYLRYWFDKLCLRGPRRRFEEFCSVVDAAIHRVKNVSNVVWQDYRS